MLSEAKTSLASSVENLPRETNQRFFAFAQNDRMGWPVVIRVYSRHSRAELFQLD
jgi:hypothetical protein